MQSTTTSEAG